MIDPNGHDLRTLATAHRSQIHFLGVWKADIGRVPVLLLDTDLESNHPADRPITSILYVSGREMRLCQEYVPRAGRRRGPGELGIEPSVWHMNEGHSALLSLERLRRERIARTARNRSKTAMRRRRRSNAVFTTHTPVPAGNETFDRHLMHKYAGSLGPWSAGVDLDPACSSAWTSSARTTTTIRPST